MITIKKIHPSGALEVSAMVLGLQSRQVWLERKAYYGYSKDEARRLFRQYLAEHGFGLVND
jgi:hypothetical protein